MHNLHCGCRGLSAATMRCWWGDGVSDGVVGGGHCWWGGRWLIADSLAETALIITVISSGIYSHVVCEPVLMSLVDALQPIGDSSKLGPQDTIAAPADAEVVSLVRIDVSDH